jgi:hypothetical protein
MEIKTASEPSSALNRHQSRRDSGLPTVSVLSGSERLAPREARQWAEGRGRSIVEVTDHRLDAMVNAWADALASEGHLRRRIVARLARQMGEDADELEGRISRMSRSELDLFLDTSLPDQDGAGVEAACRWILRESLDGKDIPAPGLADRLGAALSGRAGVEPAERALLALKALVPLDPGPVILASRSTGGPEAPDWFESTARSLARLVLNQPQVTAILATDPTRLEAYLRLAPESREKALIRSGVIAVPGLGGARISRRPDAVIPLAASGQSGTTRDFADDGTPSWLVDLFFDVALAASEPDDPLAIDRARSAAERYLFERLESLPTTAGLFELNSTLDISFGPGRLMEVDLASHVLKLAIEIDGHYHFQGEDAYRRDRRKDFLLQKRGYLVIRILAEDVVRRLEDVLALILEAVELRRLE